LAKIHAREDFVFVWIELVSWFSQCKPSGILCNPFPPAGKYSR